MKIIQDIKLVFYRSVVMRIVIGIFFLVFIGFIWNWSLQVCSSRQPNIRILYEIETSDFYG